MLRFGLTIFISAFLLFQVQPIIGRYILPWFGGSAAVWTVCMLFFQVMLLAGYAYSHLIRTTLTLRKQALLHSALLLFTLALLPIIPDPGMIPAPEDEPVTSILWLLFLTIGLPFWLVAATAPLFQHWFNLCYPGRSPYRLYALSNTGSLLALLSYPFLVEPLLPLDTQALSWSAGFLVFTGGALLCARSALKSAADVDPGENTAYRQQPLMRGDRSLWLFLSFTGSVLLLASTSHISQDVAVVPFLWILPLSLYLLSFILCFDRPLWYQRYIWLPVYVIALGLGVYTLAIGSDSSIVFQVAVFSLLMFAGCMVCHGELVRNKPHPSRLTVFYLYVAAGGALGGIFVGVIAPLIFNDYLEFPLVWILIILLAGLCLFQDTVFRTRERDILAKVSWGGAALFLGVTIYTLVDIRNEWIVDAERNFYGVLRVQDTVIYPARNFRFRELQHGRIIHGGQFIGHPELRNISTTYYAESSGIGVAIETMRQQTHPLSIGAVGLGVGTIAALTRIGDHLRFYEINPEVGSMAREHFTYLEHSPATLETVPGDARISLNREPDRNYDVLAIDAFSGDAIPAHLLTLEAFEIYLDQLQEGGILAVHISNLYLDLRPVVYAAARAHSLEAITVTNREETDNMIDESDWILLGRSLEIDLDSLSEDKTVLTRFTGTPVAWTDNYSNLLSILD